MYLVYSVCCLLWNFRCCLWLFLLREEMSDPFLNPAELPDTRHKIFFLMGIKPALLVVVSLANKTTVPRIPCRYRYLFQNQLL